jgi:hypothetical protein
MIRRFDPLNHLPYHKEQAMGELQERTRWRPYPGKHFESVITRFHQSYILPVKFGMDKRRLHLSGLIWSGQLTQAAALVELESAPCPDELLRQDYRFVLKKLNLTETEFLTIMATDPRTYREYPNQLRMIQLHQSAVMRLRRVFNRVQKLVGE